MCLPRAVNSACCEQFVLWIMCSMNFFNNFSNTITFSTQYFLQTSTVQMQQPFKRSNFFHVTIALTCNFFAQQPWVLWIVNSVNIFNTTTFPTRQLFNTKLFQQDNFSTTKLFTTKTFQPQKLFQHKKFTNTIFKAAIFLVAKFTFWL